MQSKLLLFFFCLYQVQMIFNMMNDIFTFFEIMLILFLGFTMCLMFIMGSIHEDFDGGPIEAGLTLFRAALGDFDFGGFNDALEDGKVNKALVWFGVIVMLIYLIIGSLVFLNLLIAMMAVKYSIIILYVATVDT